MRRKHMLLSAVVLLLVGCGRTESEPVTEPAAPRPSVLDPMTSTIGRAQAVQQTLDEQAAEQRRRLEEAER